MNHLEQANASVNEAFSTQNAPEAPRTEAPAPKQTQTSEQTTAETLALDKLEKFKFGDREWTPEQLKKSMMLQSDYTKKTQAVAEKTRYYDNLEADLDSVRMNPAMRQEFMNIYPKEFHKYLKLINGGSGSEDQSAAAKSQTPVDPEIMARLSKVDQFETYFKDLQAQKAEAELDSKFSVLSKKYPEASEDVVLARAQTLLDQNVELTNEVWDKLWKQSHEFFVGKLKASQKQTLTTQRDANSRGRGPGAGGGTPGQAPQKMKLKDVAEFAISELRKG